MEEIRKRDIRLWVDHDQLCFNAPKGAMTTELRSMIGTYKFRILDLLREATPTHASVEAAIQPADRGLESPLSFAQQRLWIIDRMNPENNAYNIPYALGVDGPLRFSQLERALTAVVMRHESLRTNFQLLRGKPVQIFDPSPRVKPRRIDLTGLPTEKREAELAHLLETTARDPFDLLQDPLLRVILFELKDQAAVLAFTMHHIISDGWSRGILVREFLTAYQAFSMGGDPVLPPLPIQYVDFAIWQRAGLNSEKLEQQLSYWKQKLAPPPPPIELPTDRQRPKAPSFRGERLEFTISAPTSSRIMRLGRDYGATPFITLLSVFAALLERYCHQQDFVIGTAIANRQRPELENLIGFFVNMLAIRVDLTGKPTMVDLLKRTRQIALEAYAHQDAPFEQVVDVLDLQRDLSRHPLFQVLFTLENLSPQKLEFSGLKFTPLDGKTTNAKFDLLLTICEDDSGLRGAMEYNIDLFEVDTMQRLVTHFKQLTTELVRDPHQPVRTASMLEPQELDRVLRRWCGNLSEYSRQSTIHHLVSGRAHHTPNRIAMVQEGREMTYGELEDYSDRLAARLCAIGVGFGSVVGVLAERSMETITGFLAVLKTGAAYLPLDTKYPEERICFILNDACAVLLLYQRPYSRIANLFDGPLLELQEFSRYGRDPIGGSGSQRLSINGPPMFPESLAYIIYTSGTTGTPKGVSVHHRAVNRLVLNTNFIRITPGNRMAHVTNLAFDGSVFEIWGALLNGACLVVFAQRVPSLEDLSTLVREQSVDILWLTAGLFHQAVDQSFEGLVGLRYLLAGGEVLSVNHVRKALDLMSGDSQLINGYGPTEGTVFTCCHVITDLAPGSISVPIGVPVSNTEVWILDSFLLPVPIGVHGELCIGGEGVARGYHRRPGLTAEKFVANPFSQKSGAVLYKTGDQVRFRAGGKIEFQGRVDYQIKLRGFRIELGEIESVLKSHFSVADTVVLLREDMPGNKQLVAYILPVDETPPPSVEGLRLHLSQSLPTYMIPTHFVVMDVFPLTPNGKVNRRALPAPEQRRETKAAPRHPEEQLLYDIWRGVIQTEQIGIHDVFFEIGGNSLSAIQIVSRIHHTFGVNVPVRAIFEHPSIAELGAYIRALRAQGQDEPGIPPLVPVGRDLPLPLSYAQQRMWLEHQRAPHSPHYNNATLIRVRGSVNIAVLERAIGEMIRRHETLRTLYTQKRGEPVQLIQPPKLIRMPVLDLSPLPEPLNGNIFRGLTRRMAMTAYNLATDPLLRIAVVQRFRSEAVLVVNMHHIMIDGWSFGVMAHELMALYGAFLNGGPSPLSELTIQYPDYASWERKWLGGNGLKKQLEYWKTQLAGVPSAIDLPADRPRPAIQTYRGNAYRFMIGEDLTRGLRDLAMNSGATLYMTTLAAYLVLLARYTGLSDLVIASPSANRRHKEVELLIGFFVNMLAIRVRMKGTPRFADFLKTVRAVVLDGFAHQDAPFDQIVDMLDIERSPNRAPLCQLVFALQNAPLESLRLPDLDLELLEPEISGSKYDMSLSLTELGSRLAGFIEYSTDLFDETTIQRLAAHYQNLLAAIADNPNRFIFELPLLTEEELRNIIRFCNDTRRDFPRHTTITMAFESRVKEMPQATAVIDQEMTYTYEDLNRRANRLAYSLLTAGVEPETYVAVLAERSVQTLIAILAVLKAGGAYLPIDPEFPEERVRFMLADSAARVLLVGQPNQPASYLHREVIVLDSMKSDSDVRHGERHNPVCRTSASNIAYMVYTSGTTGKPRGVSVTHASVNRLVFNTNYMDFNRGNRIAHASNVTFDAATFEIWGALLSGATLVIVSKDTLLSPSRFARRIREHGIDTLFITTALFNRLAIEQPGIFRPLRQLLFGGEAVDPEKVRTVLEHASPQRLLHVYGPTECTTFSTWHLITSIPLNALTIPIGKPLGNTECFILDHQLQPVPIGVPGELFLGGAGLARGYHGHPEQTAEWFVPCPFHETLGALLYRTGDIVLYDREGSIEFVGRRDNQVKLRGFRIELDEIQVTLLQHEMIMEALVLVREDQPGDKYLVAYVRPSGTALDLREELLEFLGKRLPDYMIPSDFVFMESFPLTTSGKIDRRALPAPDYFEAGRDWVGPRDPLEKSLFQIWSEVLPSQQLSIHDNFHEIGGHSLIATQIVSRIYTRLGVELPMEILFEAPTIAELSECVEVIQGSTTSPQPPQIQRASRDERLPLSFSQQRLWFVQQLAPDSVNYHMPFPIRFQGQLDIRALERVTADLLRRHESLRTVFPEVDGLPYQRIEPPRSVTIRMVDLGDMGEPVSTELAMGLANRESLLPFVLGKGPLLRLRLFRITGEDHLLALTLHHIVADAWSLDILVREVAKLYASHVRGSILYLPEPIIQFADYAVWQRAWLENPNLQARHEYWLQQLADAPPMLQIPGDRPRRADPGFLGGSVTFEIEPEANEVARDLGPRLGITPFMFYLTAYAVLLSRYSRQSDLVIGTPIANRNHEATERLIGFFVNMLPLRLDLSGDPSFAELLSRVRKITLHGYENQEIPFEQVVDSLHVERDLGRAPIYQVSFALQNAPIDRLELPGLVLTPLPLDTVMAKDDLSLALSEMEGKMNAVIEYNANLFEPNTVRLMVRHFQRLLNGIARDPDRPISQYSLFGLQEADRIAAMNPDRKECEPALVHELFESLASRHSTSSITLIDDPYSDWGSITYAELNHRADRIAGRLQSWEIGPETVVAILVDRTLETIAAVLGVLKAGGVFLPLDTSNPIERLAFILEDSRAVLLLGSKASSNASESVDMATLSGEVNLPFLYIEDWRYWDPTVLNHRVSPGNLAYLIYTSGTTGEPKGVVIEHQNLAGHCLEIGRIYHLNEKDVALQFYTFAFDASLEVLFSTLFAGAHLILRGETLWTTAEFGAVLDRKGVTYTDLPTAYWAQLIADWSSMKQKFPDVAALRILSVGGDVMQSESVALWRRHCPSHIRLINSYGPTETTIGATYHDIPSQFPSGRIPIGRPYTSRTGYALTTGLEPTPLDIPSELFLGGDYLSRGYVRRPALTASRFLPDPFNARPGSRLYRTGDMVRIREQETGVVIEFLGRVDHQIKLRGFRIELEEIEAVLVSQAMVLEAAVVCESVAGGPRLRAYLRLEKVDKMDNADIRRLLSGRLPDYMIPSEFIVLEQFPMTASGKINRAALPEPVLSTDIGVLSPRTSTEELLLEIWTDSLERKTIGIQDNFFEAGGHSLIATQIIARIEAAMGIRIPLRRIFETPTIAEMGAYLDELRPNVSQSRLPIISPVARDEVLPLSFSQRRLWFLDRLQGPNTVYNMPLTLRLEGNLDVEALEDTLVVLIQRHEVFRTVFENKGGQAVLKIDPEARFQLRVIDVTGFASHHQANDPRDPVRELFSEAVRPFDLTRGPLMRAHLAKTGRSMHALLIDMHHIISDGWSLTVLTRELVAIYEAEIHGRPNPLSPLPIQYADYAAWQHQWLTSHWLEAQIEYWRVKLAGLPPLLELFTDHPRPAVEGHHGAIHTFSIDPRLSPILTNYCRQERGTLFMALLATFEILLVRYSNQTDFAIGVPIANRQSVQLENLIGFFVNTLVYRADLSGNPTFRQLLGRARDDALAAHAHQDAPFERVLEAVQPYRSLSYSPLFQVMFVLQNVPGGQTTIEGLTLKPLSLESRTTRFDLTLSMADTPEGLRGSLEYNSDLFELETVARMMKHLAILLESALDDPSIPVASLPMLGEAERERVLMEWNQSRKPLLEARCIHHLIEAQVKQVPERRALLYRSKTITYDELDRRSESLARCLTEYGVSPETIVGICMPRGEAMVVGLLAILKSGAAYMPMDPDYPRDRLGFMLADTHAPMLLTDADRREFFSDFPGIVLDPKNPETEGRSHNDKPIPREVTPENLAYVIYTSGSTGQPKGVALTHRGTVALLSWGINYFGNSLGGVLAVTSICFDLSIFELFLPLSGGGAIILAENILDLPELPEREEITLINTVPSAIEALLLHEAIPSSEVAVNLAGEALPGELVDALYSVESVRDVFNLYGPSEDSTYATVERVPREHGGKPTIGHSLDNKQAYILDRAQQPTPIGVPGELYLAGVGLARGYFARPALTARRFVPNAFSREPGSRFYRTGDLGRRRSDGAIDFVGRIDDQVKLFGFRIELGEIEAILQDHPQVNRAVAIVREDMDGHPRLAGYVVPEAKNLEFDAEALRDYLRTRLPGYMVPSTFTILDRFPLTPNGKIDRRCLPLPVGMGSSNDYVQPRTLEEKLLAEIWAGALHVPRVGIQDNFFELGGQSMLATRVVSRISREFGLSLPIRVLFEYPTIAELGSALERAGAEADAEALPAIVSVNRDQLLPLSFAQQRLWILDQLEPNTSVYNIPLAIRFQGVVRVALLEPGLEAMAARHESLRTTFATVEKEPVQVISETHPDLFRVVDLRSLPKAVRDRTSRALAVVDHHRPFDLSRGPLIRCTLILLAREESVFLLNMHHIISDGWSMVLYIQEMAAIYEALCRGEEPSLPRLQVQYADFAHWQRQWLRGRRLDRQLAYWKRRFAEPPEPLALPTDRPRPKTQTYRGNKLEISLDPGLLTRIQALGKDRGVTTFMILLTGFYVLLSRYSHQQGIAVGSAISNRNYKETESMIGFFVNMLVLRIDLSGNPTFMDLLERVRQMALDAYSHAEAPFERVVESVHIKRDTSRSPLFQVAFDLQNIQSESIELSGLKLSSMDLDTVTAKYDLSMSLTEIGSRFEGYAEYNTDLFDRATIERMIAHYREILSVMTVEPERRIRHGSILTAVESKTILVGWNQTESTYPSKTTLQDLFAARTARTPDAVAVASGQSQWTYEELRLHAYALAGRLREAGVGPETMVALLTDRSVEAIIALLAILEAGGAYLPLDPSFPHERLGFMLRDTGAPILLAQRGYLNESSFEDVAVIPIEPPHTIPDRVPNLPSVCDAENLAYVIYTSGSAGNPKGVAVPHRAVNRLVMNTNYIVFDETNRVAHASNLAFDAATFEIWGTLLHGGRLVITPKGTLLTAPRFHTLILDSGIDTLFLTTALFNQFAKEIPTLFASLKQLLFGGEAVDPDPVRYLLRHGPPQRLLHVYGPTESTTYATWFHVREIGESDHNIPIGGPLGNTEVHVLDASANPVPIGVHGELYIGGDGLSRCYYQNAIQTAQKFIPHPFSLKPSVRLYKTGDLVRRRVSGAIDFIGRRDYQVKVRGFRIELEEIAAVLVRHEQIGDAVVLLREDRPGDKRLLAYIQPGNPGFPESSLIETAEACLAEQLPDYMMPSDFVIMDHFPLTPSGKINRRALPTSEERSLGKEETAPRTKTEERMLAIWKEVMNRDVLGIHDDFFELGGHSLMATQIITRVYANMALLLPMETLFETPTVAKLSEYIEPLLGQTESAAYPPFQIVSRDGPLPLSFAQQRLWVIDRLNPNSVNYNIPFSIRIEGRLAVNALERSVGEIVGRHEALRTLFPAKDGKPIQFIRPAEPYHLPIVDLSGLPDGNREVSGTLSQMEAFRPFDLERGPLFRLALIRGALEDHILLASLHHIIADGWSMGILTRELAGFYHFSLEGTEPMLPAMDLQYADFAVWQRSWLEDGTLDRLLDFWKSELMDAPRVLELPRSNNRQDLQSFTSGRIDFSIDQALSDRIREISQKMDATLFMTLLAAFAALLSRYSNQDDLVIGTPIANRNYREVENLIGFFVNMLAIRLRLREAVGFRDLLEQVKKTTLKAYAHQDVPFDQVVEAIQPERDPSRTPIFQVVFSLQNAPLGQLELAGLTLHPVAVPDTMGKFDLNLDMLEVPGGLIKGSLSYNAELYEKLMMEKMAEHFQRLLVNVVAHPGLVINANFLLSDHERLQIVESWNRTDEVYDYPRQANIPLELIAKTEPDLTALHEDASGRTLTYGALADWVESVALMLRDRGVVAESTVGVYMNRSIEMIVAIYGILKAGGAYVPLDPELPGERLAFLVEDAGLALVLTAAEPNGHFPVSRAELLRLPVLRKIEDRGRQNAPFLTGRNAAYMIYTSGSTGRPKGVIITHRNALNHIWSTQKSIRLSRNDRMMHKTPFSFDVSVLEFFWPLSLGAGLVIAKPDGHRDPSYLIEAIRRHGITVIHFVPSMFKPFLEQISSPLPLRQLIVGAESLNRALFDEFADKFSMVRLDHRYGPTETTVAVSSWQGDPRSDWSVAPIGKPYGNTRLYNLDAMGAPVPLNVVGELYIGGVCLARGYHGRPGLTAEKFVPNPYSRLPGTRLYRSGDLVYRRSDGNLVFFGRVDQQVKVQGYRIELGEIESVLAAHPSVRIAAAKVWEDKDGRKYLAAYVVPSGEELDQETLRDYLSSRLPPYMVPSILTTIRQMPLTDSGKKSRKALPEPKRGRSRRYVLPRTGTEARLATLWESVLRVPSIGVTDHFFELGGHSLKAVQLVSRIESAFDVKMPLAHVFNHPTIEAQALLIDSRVEPSNSPLVPLSTESEGRPWFLVHPGGGQVHWYFGLAEHLGKEAPVYGLQALGFIDPELVYDNLSSIAERYLEAIRTVQPKGPYRIAGWSLGGTIAFEMACQLEKNGDTVEYLALIDALRFPSIKKVSQKQELALISNFMKDLLGTGNVNTSRWEADLKGCSDSQRLKYILSSLTTLGVLPPGFEMDHLKTMYRVFSANFRAVTGARSRKKDFHGAVLLIRSTGTVGRLSEPALRKFGDSMGWQVLCTQPILIRDIEGDHYSILAKDRVETLAELLRQPFPEMGEIGQK